VSSRTPLQDSITRTPLQDAIDRIGEHGDHVDLAAGQSHGQTTVSASAFKDVGQPGGWSVGGTVQWVKQTGLSWMGMARWRPNK
jgi:hypothetical protein